MDNRLSELEDMEKDPNGRVVLEAWPRLPLWLKLWVVVRITWHTWQGQLLAWWLKVAL